MLRLKKNSSNYYTYCNIARIAVCFLLGIIWSGSSTAVSAQNPSDTILQLVNQIRAEYGLPAYQYNPALATAAQEQANWMSQTAIYSHNHNGSTPQTRADAAGYPGYVTENIVGGTSLTPQQGVTWWRNSPIHFNTIISTRYTQAGVGFAAGESQNFYVLVVGNPGSGTAPPRNNTITETAVAPRVAPIQLSPPQENGAIIHTVQTGHTLWAIAARYEIPLETLLLYNNLNEDTPLQPGSQLTIRLPEGAEPPATPTPPATHIVRAGETAWTIAARYPPLPRRTTMAQQPPPRHHPTTRRRTHHPPPTRASPPTHSHPPSTATSYKQATPSGPSPPKTDSP